MHDENERDHLVELEVAADQDEAVPLRIEPDDPAPDTLRAGKAHIVFDPATESVTIDVTRARPT